MSSGSFGDDDTFWKEFAAQNNIGNPENDPFANNSGAAASASSSNAIGDGHTQSAANNYSNIPNRPHNKANSVKTTTQFLIALAIAGIPIGFYLLQPDNLGSVFSSFSSSSPTVEEREFALQQEARRISETLNKVKAAGKPKVNSGTIQPVKPAAKSMAANNVSGNGQTKSASDAVNKESALEHAGKHSDPQYVCPMHPSVVNTDPNAICPICGMDLVLIESGGESGMVTLTPTVMNSLGVRTAKAKRRTLYRRINSVGYVNVDENNIRVISLRTEGWVERLVVKTAGEHVSKGQLLFEIYSPVLVNAQDEFLQALHHSNKLLITASRERLLALGVSQDQIDTLEKTKKVEQLVQVYAPQNGIISELNVREGMHVKPSQTIVNLVDLSSVWLMIDIFERQANWVKKGQRAEATLPFMPGRSWEGMVEYVYPSLDATTRSLKVRLRFDNIKEELKPNMYADVAIYAKPKKKALAIPREALIRTGKEKRVIVALGDGKFMPMSVQVGMETDSKIEILSGLSEGDEVVTSSQFLIDSESSLKASLARMAGGG